VVVVIWILYSSDPLQPTQLQIEAAISVAFQPGNTNIETHNGDSSAGNDAPAVSVTMIFAGVAVFAVVLCAVAVVAQPPIPSGYDFWQSNTTTTMTFQNTTQKFDGYHWNDKQGKRDRVDNFPPSAGRPPSSNLIRLDANPPAVYNMFVQQGQLRCRSRKADVNVTVDHFGWLQHAATKFTGEATILGQVCNKFENSDAAVRFGPHTLFVLKSNNKTPVQSETGRAGQRHIIVQFTNFKFDRPAPNVFDVPTGCPPVPPVDQNEN